MTAPPLYWRMDCEHNTNKTKRCENSCAFGTSSCCVISTTKDKFYVPFFLLFAMKDTNSTISCPFWRTIDGNSAGIYDKIVDCFWSTFSKLSISQFDWEKKNRALLFFHLSGDDGFNTRPRFITIVYRQRWIPHEFSLLAVVYVLRVEKSPKAAKKTVVNNTATKKKWEESFRAKKHQKRHYHRMQESFPRGRVHEDVKMNQRSKVLPNESRKRRNHHHPVSKSISHHKPFSHRGILWVELEVVSKQHHQPPVSKDLLFHPILNRKITSKRFIQPYVGKNPTLLRYWIIPILSIVLMKKQVILIRLIILHSLTSFLILIPFVRILLVLLYWPSPMCCCIGNIPIHIAAQNGYIGIVRILLDKSCAINAVNKKGIVITFPHSDWLHWNITVIH